MNDRGQYVQRPRKTIASKQDKKLRGEVWKKINLPTHKKYFVSNKGRLRSFVKDKTFGHILKNKLNSGYLSFDYTDIHAKQKVSILVHKLVAIHFLKKPKDFKIKRYLIIHKNYNHFDNSATNLQYVDTQKWRDRIQHRSNPRRLQYLNMDREKVARLKKELHERKLTVKALAEKYQISAMQVARIDRGDCWPDVLPGLTRQKVKTNYTPKAKVNKIILALKKQAMKQKEIALKYNVSETVVHRIKKKHLNQTI